MELNEMEKKLLFQVEGDYQTKILNELYMTVRYSNNSEQREAAEGLMWPGAAMDWLIGFCGAAIMRLAVYLRGKDAKKYRKNVEYGSARWSA